MYQYCLGRIKFLFSDQSHTGLLQFIEIQISHEYWRSTLQGLKMVHVHSQIWVFGTFCIIMHLLHQIYVLKHDRHMTSKYSKLLDFNWIRELGRVSKFGALLFWNFWKSICVVGIFSLWFIWKVDINDCIKCCFIFLYLIR